MIKKGRGISCITHPTGMKGAGDPDNVIIKLKPDGNFDLIVGTVDIGQGAKTVLRQFAAEELDVPLENIVLINDNTDTSGVCTGTFASRATFCSGNAVLAAVRDLKQKMRKVAGQYLKLNPDELIIGNNKIFKKDNPEIFVDIPTLAVNATWIMGEFLVGHGAYLFSPPAKIDPDTGAINSAEALAYGACVVDVEVDTETGFVEIKKIYSTYEVGRIINELMVEEQIEGGTVMGIGMALMEDLAPYYPSLDYQPDSFTDYIIPTAMDVPEMVSSAIENPDPDGPYGAKGFSEMTLSAVPPATVNAIYDAIGVWIDSVPITPEKVLKALEQKDKNC
jgi:CO/xanthine dehydrogenase Mo-binding subunit